MKCSNLIRWLVATGLVALPITGFPVDGVIEINQTRALAGGVTTGDAPGFPVTLSESGSYLLTGNLNVPEATNGIEINTSTQSHSVTLDLNGFEVAGQVVCTFASPDSLDTTCVPSDLLDISGIVIDSSNVTIRNGTVRGFPLNGIRSRNGASYIYIDQLLVTSNAVGGGNCGGIDFNGAWYVSVINSRIVRNGNNGHSCHGLRIHDSSQVRDSIIAQNRGRGIYAVQGAHEIVGNTIHFNAEDGIKWDTGNAFLVLNNSITYNGGFGINGDGAVYAGNVININNGTVSGGEQIGTNFCDGNTTCP